MKNSLKTILLSAFVLSATTTAFAQQNSVVDPGVSIHNYKQPHKIKKAEQLESTAARPNQVSLWVQPRLGQRYTATPKYAHRPGTIIIGATQSGKDFKLNPLDSPNHYKLHDGGEAERKPTTRFVQNQEPVDPKSTERID